MLKNTTIIFAIESSCDETACAIIQKNQDEAFVRVLASTTATSLHKHKATKGIVPEIAAREQLRDILPVIEETLEKSQIEKSQIDYIAVTVGPGLVGSLLVGIETAKALAMAWKLPVIPVHHLQAHPYANVVYTEQEAFHPIEFPLLSWVISGGHTELYLMNSHQDLKHLGGTVDDAAGECFDKCARVLGFDYPGGPYIEKLALENTDTSQLSPIHLPRPLIGEKDYRLSFSGLKTAFLRLFKQNTSKNNVFHIQLARELQNAISDVIIKKTRLALSQFPEVKTILISGGVAANKRLQERFTELSSQTHITIHFPSLSLCTDNAVMIGAYAAFHTQTQTRWDNLSLQLD